MMLLIIIIPLVNTGIIQRDGHEEWAEGWAVAHPPASTTLLGGPFPRVPGMQVGQTQVA